MIHPFFLLAQNTPAGQQPQSSPLQMLVPFALMAVIFYFLLIRPQRKRQQELQAQINSLKGGDTIVTTGGMHGIVSSLQERTLTLKIADNVKIKIEKSSVASIVKRAGDAEAIEVPAEESK
jgi:preprotein translocase subunit YajC